jgi:hypothetical protein
MSVNHAIFVLNFRVPFLARACACDCCNCCVSRVPFVRPRARRSANFADFRSSPVPLLDVVMPGLTRHPPSFLPLARKAGPGSMPG